MADWSDLRYFLELSRSGTLAAAAKKLRVDYTTVGRRLAVLERDLGAKLFERTPEGLVLTEAGEGIRAATEEMEQAAILVEQRALGADRKLAGLVRVATTEMLGQVVVLPAVRTLHEIHPQIRVDVATGAPRLDLARREADVALRYVRPDSGELVSRRAARVAQSAYASRGYLASHPRPVAGTGFAGQDVVMLEIRALGGTRIAGEEPTNGRLVLRTNNSLALHRAVALGIGIGALPCYIGDSDRELRRVFPDAPVDLEDLWLVVHADLTRTSRVRAVIDAIEARLEEVAGDLIGERSSR